jgi:anti-sigma B factor antagonist
MTAEKLTINTEELDGIVMLHAIGYIDAHTSKLLQSAVADLYSKGKYKLVVDLAKVKYMSSSGASLLIVMQNDARAKKGDVILLGVTREVKQVLAILGLDELFKFFTDKKLALAEFKA